MTTNIVILLDKSYSMRLIYSQVVETINDFISTNQIINPNTNLSLILFNHFTEDILVNEQLANIDLPLLTSKNYRTEGATSLYDAVAYGINLLDNNIKQNKFSITFQDTAIVSNAYNPVNIIAIITDDNDNTSTLYNENTIVSLITEKMKEDWRFIFAGSKCINEEKNIIGNIPNIIRLKSFDNNIGKKLIGNNSIDNFTSIKATMSELDLLCHQMNNSMTIDESVAKTKTIERRVILKKILMKSTNNENVNRKRTHERNLIKKCYDTINNSNDEIDEEIIEILKEYGSA